MDGSAGGDANQKTLLAGQASRHGKGLFVANLDDLVDYVGF